jgi:hypothetical protein
MGISCSLNSIFKQLLGHQTVHHGGLPVKELWQSVAPRRFASGRREAPPSGGARCGTVTVRVDMGPDFGFFFPTLGFTCTLDVTRIASEKSLFFD